MLRKSRIFILAAMASVASAVSLSVIFDRYPAGVTDNVITPDFNHQCSRHTSRQFLDHDGQLNLAVWNIYKQQKTQWDAQLQQLLDNNQLVLLQEASLTKGLQHFLHDQQRHISMARAFSGFDTVNGVMNLAGAPSIEVCAELAMEPIIRLAKSALVATYPLSNGQELMVVNVHSINFSWELTAYHQQLHVLAKAIAAHKGPVILAGDFNTWRKRRLDLLTAVTQKLGLHEAAITPDDRTRFFGHPLDHIYYRGLTLEWAKSPATKASDHSPMLAQFSLKTQH